MVYKIFWNKYIIIEQFIKINIIIQLLNKSILLND